MSKQSAKKPQKPMKVVAAFDTETTDLGDCAFTYLYTFAIDGHTLDSESGQTEYVFARTEGDAVMTLCKIVAKGKQGGYVPVVVAYNLAFDLQTLLADIAATWAVNIVAKTPSELYAFDLLDGEGAKVLRFWDLHGMNPNGVAELGRIVGIPKLHGNLDYTKVRHALTPLSETELAYCRHDVDILLAYCRWLLRANDWLRPEWLGSRLMTNAGLVRLYAQTVVGNLKFRKSDKRKSMSTRYAYARFCATQLPKDLGTYRLRKACTRGGLNINSANAMRRTWHRVSRWDCVSMYHAFLNGDRVPCDFQTVGTTALRNVLKETLSRTTDEILEDYARPFPAAFHAHVVLKGVRIKQGTPWDRFEMGVMSYDRFRDHIRHVAESDTTQDTDGDTAQNPEFAYGKLFAAGIVDTCVNEVEWWLINQVYEVDSWEVISGEISNRWKRPFDYVAIQSNVFYEWKSEVKQIAKAYTPGKPYAGDSGALPDGLAALAKTGELTGDELDAYYALVKGQFNSIIGNQAAEQFRASWELTQDAEIRIDPATRLTPENFKSRKTREQHVDYPWGARIIARGRLHLVLAVMLIWDALGQDARIISGDTDSLKIAMRNGVTETDIRQALKPLHEATRHALDETQSRLRRTFPDLANSFEHVGEFVSDGETFVDYWELADKMRLGVDSAGIHVTAAGIKRGTYAEATRRVWEDTGRDLERTARIMMDMDTCLSPNIARSMGRERPRAMKMVERVVTDWTGKRTFVHAHAAIRLREQSTWIMPSTSETNKETRIWRWTHLGERPGVRPHYVSRETDGRIVARSTEGEIIYTEGEGDYTESKKQ